MMAIASGIATALVAAIHVYIFILEVFLWTKPTGLRAFHLTPEFAQQTRTLAANQGLYNGFLAAGLIFGLVRGEPGRTFVTFFLTCVLIAGLYGAATSSRKILFVQAFPAAVALALQILNG